MKDWTFKVHLLTGELSSLFQLIESLKMTCARAYTWFLNLLLSREGLDCFWQPNILPKLGKIIVTCPKSLKWPSRVSFDLSKVIKMTINFWTNKSRQNDQFENPDVSSHGKARNIKFRHQVNFIQRVQLSPLPKEVVTSLPQNHMTLTNLFISSYSGATVIKFGQ